MVEKKLTELNYSDADSATQIHTKITTAICGAAKATLPVVKRGKGVRRKVSATTTSLYEQRSRMRGKIPEQFKALQGKIRQAGLDDFKDWVRKCAEEAEKAESIGDTKAVFNIVKQMQGLSEKPPKNLNTDADGNVLLCADEVAAT